MASDLSEKSCGRKEVVKPSVVFNLCSPKKRKLNVHGVVQCVQALHLTVVYVYSEGKAKFTKVRVIVLV